MNKTIIFWSLVAALSGFLFGFDTAVISGAERAVQQVWQMSDVTHGLALSMALWGTVIGALCGGIPSDRFGRKPTLIAIGILYSVSAIGSALAWDPASFMFFRFIGGLGVGASSVAAPMFIAEVAPARMRGRLVAAYQLNLVIGILAAFASNYALGGTGETAWRWMLGVEALPALIYAFMSFLIPESPRWLIVKRGKVEEARNILRQIDPDRVEKAVEEITATEPDRKKTRFFSSAYAFPIMLVVLLAFFNQVSGINVIIYYAPRILAEAGFADSAALLATVGVGVVNLLFTVVGIMLIDRAGRKFLMLIGSIGYITSLVMVAYGFLTDSPVLITVFIMTFIASHAVGQGAVIWVYIAEVFPNAVRASGQALGTGVHWVSAAVLTLVTPAVLAAFPAWSLFAFFAVMMCFQLIYVLTMMVETRNRTLEDLSQSLKVPASVIS